MARRDDDMMRSGLQPESVGVPEAGTPESVLPASFETAQPVADAKQLHQRLDTQKSPDDPGKTSEERSGSDTRRRGWFWHWNTIVTQYAPLLGLKGIGLLNSYTVWTDRRDESPHRGYAFPSQQAEADFYGEDRAELITINKILVALGLIEIRKEMLVRSDDKGRRWRVPHNLYRVKDRPEGLQLRAEDVLRVAELAAGDEAVYRYVRRVFSPRFRPIDRDNVWHEILDHLREHPLWRELQQRAERQEQRASARTRAGHRTRASSPTSERDAQTTLQATRALTSGHKQPDSYNAAEQAVTDADTSGGSVGRSNDGSARVRTGVDVTNKGWDADVAPSNDGLSRSQQGIAEPGNSGCSAVVAGSNTTKKQGSSTTTTTTRGGKREVATDEREHMVEAHRVEVRAPESGRDAVQRGGSASTGGGDGERHLADQESGGPVGDPSPLVVSTFEAANDRGAKPLERILLAELERDADSPARAAGSTGAEWVVAAVREAVASGSSFVAPKRIREIITRWTSDPGSAPNTFAVSMASSSTVGRPVGSRSPGTREPSSRPGEPTHSQRSATSPAPEVRLPGGAHGSAVWSSVLAELSKVFAADTFDRLLANSVVTRYWRGTVEIRVASDDAAAKLSGEYRGLIERHLNSRLSRPVAARFWSDPEPTHSQELSQDIDDQPDPARSIVVTSADLELGRQLWQAVVADLSAVATPEDLVRMSRGIVLGEDATGMTLLTLGSAHARRLVEMRYRQDIERSLTTLFGRSLTIRIIEDGEWSVVDGATSSA